MAVHTIYVSAACNWSRHSADWGSNNLICFGSCNSVVVYDPKKNDSGEITHTLCQHKGAVNSVRWMRSQNDIDETELVSTSCDATAILWKKNTEASYTAVEILKGHGKDVIIADGIKLVDSSDKHSTIIVTASIDSTIKIWMNNDKGAFICTQTIDLQSEMCFETRLCLLPESSIPLLICSNTDCKIYLYAKEDEKFVKVNVLQGHEDFVRTMDITYCDSLLLPSLIHSLEFYGNQVTELLGMELNINVVNTVEKILLQDPSTLNSGSMLIASGDQAGQIRIWRLRPKSSSPCIVNNGVSTKDFKPEERSFTVTKNGNAYSYTIAIESVILAHDGMINGLQWHPKLKTDNGFLQPMKILSSSMDKSMVLWEPDFQSGVWLESVRVGEVGGNSLGFFGCKFGPNGESILAYGKQGSFHVWHLNQDNGTWEPKLSASGHCKSVMDIHWEPAGEFLLSVSSDQTTRLHAPWRRDDGKVSWHEIARPQIHGHDMSCIAVLSRYKFASGAEEKVGRVFEAPRNFIENFHRICKIKEDTDEVSASTAPQGASVPSLGLSNKAVYEGHEEKNKEKSDYPESYFSQVDLYEPPTEEHLMQNTLWPEVQKLYGHGYDIFCMAATHDGSILATACKSTTLQHAAIIIWDAHSWKIVQKLESHTLTVTQMAFSPNDQFLLSVSRDRQWSIFERVKNDSNCDSSEYYKLAAVSPKVTSSHSRIIWSCSWSDDSKHFVTSSREGKVIVWGMNDNGNWNGPKLWPLKLSESVTATSFTLYPDLNSMTEKYIILLGTEGGLIYIYKWQPKFGNETDKGFEHLKTLDNEVAHHKTVKRIVFRPIQKIIDHAGAELQFASCGDDHMVKIYRMILKL